VELLYLEDFMYDDDLFESRLQQAVEKELEKLVDNPDRVIAAYVKKLDMAHRQMDSMMEEFKPKADFYDTVTQSSDWSEMAQVAKLIGFKGWGRNNIFKLLQERGVLRFNKEPYQTYVESGYFKVVEQYFTLKGSDETMINKKTVVSQKGIDFIRRILIGEGGHE
jgi:anti-repressor protein